MPQQKKTATYKVTVFFLLCLQIVTHTVGGGLCIGAESHGELHHVLVAEALQPVEEHLRLVSIAVVGNLAQVVHIDMRNIVITRIQAADKAAQALKRIQIILTGVLPNTVLYG